MQPPRGVDQHEVDASRAGSLDGIEGDRAGIAALLTADHVDAEPVTPHRELVGRGGAERVRRREQHRVPVGERLRGELRGRRGLAGAVDADEEPRVRPTRLEVQRPVRVGGIERRDDLLLEEPGQVVRVASRRPRPARRRTASTSAVVVSSPTSASEQRLFEVVPRLVVDAAGTHPPTHARERGA